MPALNERIASVKAALKQYPDKKDAIMDLYYLMEDEIIDGGSPDHELELFQDSIKEMQHDN